MDHSDCFFDALEGSWGQMGRLVDRPEDGDAFEGCYERVRAWVDHCYAADALCGSSSTVGFFHASHGSFLVENRDFGMHQSLHSSDTVRLF